jgi:hypothetical protein
MGIQATCKDHKASTKPILITFLPCVQTNDSKISMLSRDNIKDVGLQPATPPSPASPVTLAKVYLGQTSLSRLSETASLAYPAQTTRNISSGQGTIQSQIITSNSGTLKFSLPNPATWARSSQNRLRWSSIPTTYTEDGLCSAGH